MALLRKMTEILKSQLTATEWQRCVGCLIFVGHSPQKSPVINGSFAERDLQLKVLCIVAALYRYSFVQHALRGLFRNYRSLFIGLFRNYRSLYRYSFVQHALRENGNSLL